MPDRSSWPCWAGRASGGLVIAVDGKAVRGAKDKEGKAPHLVAALARSIGAVLGQVAAAAKPNRDSRGAGHHARDPQRTLKLLQTA